MIEQHINILCKKKTIVLFVICLVLLVKDHVSTSPASESVNRSIRSSDDPICNSTTCSELGHFLRASLNSSADPCEDFYAFACGGWVRRHATIPDSESYIDEWTKLQKNKVNPAMIALFEGPDLDPKKMAHSVVLAQALFKDCADQSKRNQLSWKPFQDTLKSLLGFAWPRENYTSIGLPERYIQEIIARFATIDVQPFFKMKPIVDKVNPSRRIIRFSQPFEFGLPRYVFEGQKTGKHTNQYQAYRNFLKQVFLLIEQANVVGNSQKITESMLDKRIDAVLKLESQLALATLPESEAAANNIDIWSNRMKYSDFSRSSLDFKFIAETYVSMLLNRTSLTAEERATDGLQWMVVTDKAYFQNMSRLVFEPENSGKVWLDYLALQFIYQYRNDGPSDLSQAAFELKRVTEGLKTQPPVWEGCLEQVQWRLPLPAARLYVDANVDNRTRGQAVQIAKSIKDEFEYILKHKADWLDEESIERGKRKLRKARIEIGFSPFLQNNTELDRAFGLHAGSGRKIAFKKGHYLDTLLAVTKFARGTEATELWARRDNNSEIYELSPMHVNAFAIRDSNVTFIPIALLQPPFFDPNRPTYLQLAGIGETIGHELLHLFDDQNLKRRPDGQRPAGQWWTDQADQKLKQQVDCFERQYSNLTDPDTRLKVNGRLTMRENIADNGATRALFYAFETLEKREKKARRKLPRLPHMTSYTPEQTFLIAHAQIFCSRTRPETAQSFVMTNPHAPSRYRLNVPLANLKQFSKTFECKKGSAMRPENRCRIW